MTDWSDVVRRHGPMVWATAWRLLGDHADASDCFQDTFVAAVKLARREQVKNWAGLLKRVATARALDRLRQRTRDAAHRSAILEVEPSGGWGKGFACPSSEARAAELAEQLRLALAELPAQQAQAFCLHALEGWTYEQVAVELQTTPNHAGVLIHRARQRLRSRLGSFERMEP